MSLEPVIVIVENEAGRIRNLLLALAEVDITDGIRSDAQAILNGYPGERKKDGSVVGNSFPSIINSYAHIKVICPNEDQVKTFKPIEEVFFSCQNCPAICFLDMKLENSVLDTLSERKPLVLGAGIKIGEMFKLGFGRLIVHASNVSGGWGYKGPHYKSEFVATELEGAIALIKDALKKYQELYGLHSVPEVASFLGLLWRGINEKWDYSLGHPFFHDALQKSENGGQTRHLSELASYLDLHPEVLMKDSGNSAKELFEIVLEQAGKYKVDGGDHRNVSNEVLDAVLRKLGIAAKFELTGLNNKGWRFPRKPALPFLLALRSFIEATKERGPVPTLRLTGHRDGQFTGVMTFTFEHQNNGEPCALVSRYAAKSGKNTSRPAGGLSAAFYDLIRARVEVKSGIADPELSVYSCGITPMEFEPSEKDANEISVQWRSK